MYEGLLVPIESIFSISKIKLKYDIILLLPSSMKQTPLKGFMMLKQLTWQCEMAFNQMKSQIMLQANLSGSKFSFDMLFVDLYDLSIVNLFFWDSHVYFDHSFHKIQ